MTVHAAGCGAELIASCGGAVETLAGLGRCTPSRTSVPQWPAHSLRGRRGAGVGSGRRADADAERARLTKVIDAKTKQIGGLEGRLANAGYVAKAPAHLVQETRDSLSAAQADLAAAETALAALK